MADVKFTPGEWRVVEHSWRETSVYVGDDRICLLDLEDWDVTEDTQADLEARQGKYAHLMAASPDLYEALKDCVQALSHTEAGPRIDAARAALAKAEGQS